MGILHREHELFQCGLHTGSVRGVARESVCERNGRDKSDVVRVFLSGEAVARRKSVYRAFEEKGVRVFLSNAALNVDGLAYELYGGGGDEGQKLEQCRTLARTFDTYNEWAFSEYTVLVGINDCLYRGGRFYNSDYHLGSEAAEEHTALLLKRLKEHLGE